MKTRILLASLIVLACGALAPADPPANPTTALTVSVTAKGTDVKTILGDVFAQAHKNYVIQPETFFALHLTLEKVDFDEALMIISKLANLKIELQNGIYYVSRSTKLKTTIDAASTTTTQPVTIVKPTGTLPKTVLAKKLTTKFSKTDMREIFTEISKQTGVTIEFDKTVPAYKLDAFLINTSLKYALDQITEATGLSYRFTDNLSIQIFKPGTTTETENHVKVIQG